jgi:dual specificity tyrosine-phosphorylation-regulated kinase 2/3/4
LRYWLYFRNQSSVYDCILFLLLRVYLYVRENLYEFGKYIRESGEPEYFTIPRLKKIMKQVLEALQYIHSLNLIHCDIKPENIVIKSYSRCEVR